MNTDKRENITTNFCFLEKGSKVGIQSISNTRKVNPSNDSVMETMAYEICPKRKEQRGASRCINGLRCLWVGRPVIMERRKKTTGRKESCSQRGESCCFEGYFLSWLSWKLQKSISPNSSLFSRRSPDLRDAVPPSFSALFKVSGNLCWLTCSHLLSAQMLCCCLPVINLLCSISIQAN